MPRLRVTLLVVALLVTFVGLTCSAGSDSLWLVALGDHIRQAREIPVGVPFASASTADWHNVPAVGQVVFSVAYTWGPAGLAFLQVLAVAAMLVAIGTSARAGGASDRAIAATLAVVALGSLPALAVIRIELFSLAAFAACLLLLRSDERRPSRRTWLLVPLVAIWMNLHGAALVGVAVIGAYLLIHRVRRRVGESVALGLAVLVATQITPAGWRTTGYVVGVLTNEAATRGVGLWSRPDLSNPFDVLLVVAAVVLTGLAVRGGLAAWEIIVLVALAVATVSAARNGTWLLLFLAEPAACRLTTTVPARAQHSPGRSSWTYAPAAVLGLALAGSGALLVTRADSVLPVDPTVGERIVALSEGRPVLAPEPLVEQLAAEGATVWVSNPIDAFTGEDQAAYLDFLGGGPRAARAVAESGLVVTRPAQASFAVVRADPGLTKEAVVGGWWVYARS